MDRIRDLISSMLLVLIRFQSPVSLRISLFTSTFVSLRLVSETRMRRSVHRWPSVTVIRWYRLSWFLLRNLNSSGQYVSSESLCLLRHHLECVFPRMYGIFRGNLENERKFSDKRGNFKNLYVWDLFIYRFVYLSFFFSCLNIEYNEWKRPSEKPRNESGGLLSCPSWSLLSNSTLTPEHDNWYRWYHYKYYCKTR